MLRLWRFYQKCLEVHPVKTQVISSGILWGLGDIGAQAVTHSSLKNKRQNPHSHDDKEFKINWQRVGITSMFGFAFVGPVGHFWYEYLDRFIRHRIRLKPSTPKFVAAKVASDGLIFGPLDLLIFFSYMGFASGKNVEENSETKNMLKLANKYEYLDRFIRHRIRLKPSTPKFVAAKVASDGLIFGPLDLLIFFSYMGFASGKNVEEVREDVKRDFLPSLVIGGGIWPLVQIANFRYVPVRYQLLYVNFFCLLDSCFLSWIEQQGDAAWKQWFKSFISLDNHKA